MGKNNRKIFLILTILSFVCLFIIFSGCDNSAEYKSMSVFVPKEISADSFDIEDYTVVLVKKDGTVEQTAMTSEMLEEGAFDQLSSEGKHLLEVSCKGLRTEFEITVINFQGTASIAVYGPKSVTAGEFDADDYTVVTRNADGTIDEISLSVEMLRMLWYNIFEKK